MTKENKDFYHALLETAFSCGMKLISDDFCCKLLAWVYVFGGGRENTTQNIKMRSEILYAQKRLNIVGGEICNRELLPILKERVKECGTFFKPALPKWIDEIDSRYGIKTNLK